MHHESVAIHLELIALGFSSEDGMVIQDQAGFSGMGSREKQRGGHAADSAAYHGAIESFARIGDLRALAFVPVIANGVASRGNFVGVTVRSRIIANAAESGPIGFGQEAQRRHSRQ